MPHRQVLPTVSINKLSLSPFDDKRFILEGSIKTLPYGHADAIEAADLKSDPEWDTPTPEKIEDLFWEQWETDNEAESTLFAFTESWQPANLATESWDPIRSRSQQKKKRIGPG